MFDSDYGDDGQENSRAKRKPFGQRKEPPFECDALAIRSTEKALLVDIQGEGEHWIPISQIEEDSEVRQEGDQGILTITGWIAKQKGFV